MGKKNEQKLSHKSTNILLLYNTVVIIILAFVCTYMAHVTNNLDVRRRSGKSRENAKRSVKGVKIDCFTLKHSSLASVKVN